MGAEPLMRDGGECPDLETLAAYLDGRVADDERQRIAAHLADCESCYFVFAETAQIETDVAPKPAPRWWATPRLLWPTAAAGLAAAAALVLAVSGSLIPTDREAPDLTALQSALAAERTVEPRLTGGFAYAPFRAPVRSVDADPANVPPDVRIAAARVEKETASRQTPGALHARGLAALVVGDVDGAVRLLEDATAARPDDAGILNDLAAAYLVRADRRPGGGDAAAALAAVTRALARQPGLPEASFNRAHALERLALPDQARAAWTQYLTIDNRSGWADEARAHVRALGAEAPERR